MSGPWEHFQSPAPAAQPIAAGTPQGPWSHFQAPATPAAQPGEQPEDVFDMRPAVKSALGWAKPVGAVIGGIAGTMVGALGGAVAGSAVPGIGTLAGIGPGAAVGEPIGAGVGAGVASAGTDTINNYMFGGNKSAGDIAKDAATEGVETAVAQATGSALLKGGTKLAGRVAEAVVPASVITRYQQAADVVNGLIRSSAGDVAEAAEQARKQMNGWIKNFVGRATDQVNEALEKSTSSIDGNEIVGALQGALEKLHPKTQADEIKQIQAAIDMTKSMRGDTGQIAMKDANALKKWLGNIGYDPETVSEVAGPLKQSAAITRRSMNTALKDEGLPGLAAANNRLSALQSVQETMNKGMLKSGAPESSLVGAGSDSRPMNARALKILSDITGQDFTGKAQDVAAVKSFAKDSLFKRGAGAAAGATAGAGFSEMTGGDPVHGAMVGGALGGAITSPFAVKTALDIGRYTPSMTSIPAAQTLGQAVMHGSGAMNSLQQPGAASP